MLAFASVATSRDFEMFRNGRASEHPFPLALARHRRKTADAAAAEEPHQQRFGLIVTGMGGEDMAGTTLVRSAGKQTITCRPGCGRHARFRLFAGPAQRAMWHIKRARQPLDVTCFARGLRPKAVIDRHRQEMRPARKRFPPPRREPHQGDGIRAPGNGKDKPARVLPLREQAFCLLRRDRRFVVLWHDVAG